MADRRTELQTAVVRTLRYAALLTYPSDGNEPRRNILAETADAVERVTDWDNCPCCPLCDEIACDTDCALVDLRSERNDTDRERWIKRG